MRKDIGMRNKCYFHEATFEKLDSDKKKKGIPSLFWINEIIPMFYFENFTKPT